jgi:hypothetical protein
VGNVRREGSVFNSMRSARQRRAWAGAVREHAIAGPAASDFVLI